MIVKAIAGGGGRGMRVVRDAGELAKAFEDGAARSRGGVRRRRRLHREVRRAAAPHRVPDSRRSSRRGRPPRRARVLDPAPPPEADRRVAVAALTEKMRRKLGGAVVDAASAVQYTNAGTFEFLLDDEQALLFHGGQHPPPGRASGHRMVTGIDIVKEQIRIAAGERLSLQAGRRHLHRPLDRVPDQRRGSRDVRAVARASFTRSACRAARASGSRRSRTPTAVVSPYYDSMIAKIIVHGRDRHEAIARMRRTLRDA